MKSNVSRDRHCQPARKWTCWALPRWENAATARCATAICVQNNSKIKDKALNTLKSQHRDFLCSSLSFFLSILLWHFFPFKAELKSTAFLLAKVWTRGRLWTSDTLCKWCGLRRCHSPLPIFPLNTNSLGLVIRMSTHQDEVPVSGFACDICCAWTQLTFLKLDFTCYQGVLHHSTAGKNGSIVLQPKDSLLFLLFCTILSKENSASITVQVLSHLFSAATFKNLLLYTMSSKFSMLYWRMQFV